MPRHKLPDPRRNWTLRLSDDELARIERSAAVAGRRPSDYVRDRALGGVVAAPSLASERHRIAAVALATQLKRVGNNLNQLLRHVHQRPDERVPPDTALILAQIRELVRQARDL